jgi:hypothetical protein
VFLLIGALMLADRDIEIISVVASILLTVSMVPFGIQIITGSNQADSKKTPLSLGGIVRQATFSVRSRPIV